MKGGVDKKMDSPERLARKPHIGGFSVKGRNTQILDHLGLK